MADDTDPGRYFGIPGHCFDIDGYLWHEPGRCRGGVWNCDGNCCGYSNEQEAK